MTADNFLKAELARVAWLEAGNVGGWNNLIAYALMLRNRVRAGWGDWQAVLASYGQYAPIASEMSDMPDMRNADFKKLLQVVDDIYSGQLPDTMTEGALHCCELNRVESVWFRHNILQSGNFNLVAQVGQVHFYR